jgi:KRAB domain-containing zinc finger protein
MLKIHMLYSHGGEKEFKCHICDKAFFTKGRLKQHIDANHGERPWVCEICSRTFSKRYKLGEHMKQTHKIAMVAPKRHVCTLCGVNFDRNKNLQLHLRDKHQVVIDEEFDGPVNAENFE